MTTHGRRADGPSLIVLAGIPAIAALAALYFLVPRNPAAAPASTTSPPMGTPASPANAQRASAHAAWITQLPAAEAHVHYAGDAAVAIVTQPRADRVAGSGGSAVQEHVASRLSGPSRTAAQDEATSGPVAYALAPDRGERSHMPQFVDPDAFGEIVGDVVTASGAKPRRSAIAHPAATMGPTVTHAENFGRTIQGRQP